ncbi:MAG: PilX N-terminal domain-containing pilus assembly protein [Nitrospinaceae bacterium]
MAIINSIKSRWVLGIRPLPLNNESGAILVVVLLLLMVMAALVPVTVRSVATDTTRTSNYQTSKQAFYIAEAGLEHAKSLVRSVSLNDTLDGDDNNKANTADNGLFPSVAATQTWNGVNYTPVSFNNGTYYMRVIDNNDDADPWQDVDEVVIIESVGLDANGTLKQLQAKVHRPDSSLPDFPAAINVVEDTVALAPDGNSFLVDATGVIADSSPPNYATPDPNCDPKYALSTTATTGFNTSAVAGNQEDNFTGYSTDPSFNSGDPDLDKDEIEALRTQFLADPNVQTWPSAVSSGTYGSEANPGIYHVPGDFAGSGNVVGYGVLIVDQQFVALGNFEWHGLVIIGGCPTCPGEIDDVRGNAKFYGAVVASGTQATEIKMGGNAMFYYSCAALESIETNLVPAGGGFSTLAWREMN